jgi:hypothetical protein
MNINQFIEEIENGNEFVIDSDNSLMLFTQVLDGCEIDYEIVYKKYGGRAIRGKS